MADFPRWLRDRLRPAVRRVEPVLQQLGTALLGRPRTRALLNVAFERLGPWLAAPVTRFFSPSSFSASFIWRAQLRDGPLLVPVFPEHHRSLANAFVWRWPANLAVRFLYEEYVAYRRQHGAAKDRLLLDVGANDGMHSCFFAVAGWRCVAFEPQPSCIDYIKRIAILNAFDGIAVEQTTVGDQEMSGVRFYVSLSSWYSSFDRQSVERFEPSGAVSVKMVALDSYCDTRELSPACIKIDVEGYELPVLRGATRLLETTRPDLVIEVSADTEVRRGIWNLLAPLGYRGYILSQHRRRLLPLGDLNEFLSVGGGAAVDAMFTADVSLGTYLQRALCSRSRRLKLQALLPVLAE